MDERIKAIFRRWKETNIEGFFAADKASALKLLLERIPASLSVGISGSVTLEELGITRALEARGNRVFNQYRAGLSVQEGLRLRREGTQADLYLASANAVSQSGELVFLSAYGNRTAGVAQCQRVIVVCGINKLVEDLDEALRRSREYAAARNCKRLSWKTPCLDDGICRQSMCLAPEYKRMCCQLLVIEAEAMAGRLEVVIVGESLGY